MVGGSVGKGSHLKTVCEQITCCVIETRFYLIYRLLLGNFDYANTYYDYIFITDNCIVLWCLRMWVVSFVYRGTLIVR